MEFLYNFLKTVHLPWQNHYKKKSISHGNLSRILEARENIQNNQPVSKPSEMPELLVFLVTKKLTFDTKNIIKEQEHGFSHGRSITTIILIY